MISSSQTSPTTSKHDGGTDTLTHLKESDSTDIDHCNDGDCRPDINSFNQVLGAWSRGNQRGFEAKLDSIFAQLLELMEEQQNNRDIIKDKATLLKPNADTFNAILSGWLKSKRRDSIQRTEHLVRTIEDLNVKPNRITINTIQSIFAKAGTGDSLEKSNEICSSLERKYRIKADRVSSTIALVSLCKSRQPDAPERAMEILDGMERRFIKSKHGKNKQSADMPNEYTYTSVIDCFVKNQRQDAPKIAEQLLKRIRDLHLNYGGDQVSTPVLNSVINAWASCSNHDVGYASIRVRQLLQFMEAGGEKDPADDAKSYYYPKPNRITYNTVMKSMGVSGMDCDAEFAEEILKRLERMGKKGKNPALRPDSYSYTAVITAYGRSSSDKKAVKAIEILTRQIRSYRERNHDAKPNIHPFNAALNACAYCNRGSTNAKIQAFEIAEKIYSLLIREYSKPRGGRAGRGNKLIIHPDQTTYGTLLRACAALLSPARRKGHDVSPPSLSSPRSMALTTRKRQEREEDYFQAAGEKDNKIEEYFQAACENGYVGRLVITQMKFAASSKQYERLMGRDIMDRADPKDLPSSWTRNVRNDKRR